MVTALSAVRHLEPSLVAVGRVLDETMEARVESPGGLESAAGRPLGHPPDGLSELRAALLNKHQWRQRTGLDP